MKEKVLILISCNPGAFYGDYNLGRNWQLAKKYLKRLEEEACLEFAAVDCIAAELRNDAIVLESEMDIVKGYDIHPSKSKINQSELSKSIVSGLKKLKKYKSMIVWLNIKQYHQAFMSALASEELDPTSLPPVYVFYKKGRFNCGIKKFAQFVRESIKDLERTVYYKVVTKDLKSVGLLGANIVQYKIGEWVYPLESLSCHPRKAGGLWICRREGGAFQNREYLWKKHQKTSRVFLCEVGRIFYGTSYRLKTEKVKLIEEIVKKT